MAAYELPDHVIEHLVVTLGVDPASVDADTRESMTRTLTNEIQVAAHTSLANTLRTARAETMDCLHGTDRPGGLDGRFAGPLALVRALIIEIERLREVQGAEKATEPTALPETVAGPFATPAEPENADIPADETKAEKIARYSEALDFVLSPEWLPWYEHNRPDLMARLRAATQKMLDGAYDRPAPTKPVQINPADAPVPPHRHLRDHDPAEWEADCCACQNQSHGPGLFIDETCPACCAQRDGYRAYTLVEWAVRHPSGVTEEHVPEGLARRGVASHPTHVLLARERIKTPDVVGPYVEVPVERAGS